MADQKLSALTELAATPANDDEIYIRDVSEAASAESKRITVANLMDASGRSATLIVAANDSSLKSKAGADYVCDGTGDQVEIQAAIDALPVSGGTVSLSEGLFSISAQITISSDFVTIAGQGEATILKVADGANSRIMYVTATITGLTLRDFVADGNKDNQTGGAYLFDLYNYNIVSRLVMENLYLHDAYSGFAFIGGAYHRLSKCIFDGARLDGVWFRALRYSTINECYFINNGEDGVFFRDVRDCQIDIVTRSNIGRGVQTDGDYDFLNNNLKMIGYDNTRSDFEGKINYCTIDANCEGGDGSGISLGEGSTHNKIRGVVKRKSGSDGERRGVLIHGDYNQVDVIANHNDQCGVYVLGDHNTIKAIAWNNGQDTAQPAVYKSGVVIYGSYNTVENSNIGDNQADSITSDLASDALSGQKDVIVVDASAFFADQAVTIGDDTPLTESNWVASISDNTITMRNNLANTYTTAQNAKVEGRATQLYGIYEVGPGNDNNIYTGSVFFGNATMHIALLGGSADIVRDNKGYVTENSGTSSIDSGQTTKVVAHGLSATPTKINVEFREQGTNDYGRWWISGIDGTNFTLNVSADPGASNLDFAWEAKVR